MAVASSPTGIALLAGLVTLAVGCYQLSLPHVLSGVLGWNEGYDDTVDVGAALRLVNGVIPYRDFVIVHPPGIALLMLPAALIGRLAGTRDALVVGNCLTVVVTAANPVLAGWLVRGAGRLATAVASFSLGLWMLTVSVDRTVELEPYLVLLTLAGAVVVFGGGPTPSRRRLIVGGVLMGLAFVVKVWAFMPLAAVLLVWSPRWRKEGAWLAAGVLAGIVVPIAPFFVAAPGSFVHDVFTDQLTRQTVTASTPFGQRLLETAGLGGLTAFSVSSGVAVALFVVLLLVIAAVFGLGWRSRTRLEWFALLAAVITFLAMFDAPTLFDHYAYFPAAMTAPLLGVCAGRLPRSLLSRRVPLVLTTLVGAGLVAFGVQQDSTYGSEYLSEASSTASLAAYIPAGACVVSTYPVDLIDADRFDPSGPCPAPVDPYGMYLAYDGGSTPHGCPPCSATFQLRWFGWLQDAQYVELRGPFDYFIPWNTPMAQWFTANYHLVVHLQTVYAKPFIDQTHDMWLYERNP